jgi:hypothetical protein
MGGLSSCWKPVRSGEKHPEEVKRRKSAKQEQTAEKRRARQGRDRQKIRIQRQARAAERKTERKIIQATLNSGRVRQDGDHVLGGKITLDTKLQTGRTNPTILVSEVSKVQEDARRAGSLYGALVIRNQDGQGFVVMDERDFVRMTTALLPGDEKE